VGSVKVKTVDKCPKFPNRAAQTVDKYVDAVESSLKIRKKEWNIYASGGHRIGKAQFWDNAERQVKKRCCVK
jgi:hypothetical protein